MSQDISFIVLYKPNETKQNEMYFKEVIEGFSKPKKVLPSHYRYDEEGSKICSDINQVEEYYVVRCEASLLKEKSSWFLNLFGGQKKEKFNLIDLGAGSGVKTVILLQKAVQQKYPFEYILMDISHDSNLQLCKNINHLKQHFKTTVVTSWYEEGINWINENKKDKNVYFFLGSTIGNNPPEQNDKFIKFISDNLKSGDLFVIFYSLMSNPQTIQKAYFNSSGLEFKFILNQLTRINRELGGNFKLENFYPHSYFDPENRCVYGCMISKIDQTVNIRDAQIQFKKGEVIRASQSKRWYPEEVEALFLKQEFIRKDFITDNKQLIGCGIFQRK